MSTPSSLEPTNTLSQRTSLDLHAIKTEQDKQLPVVGWSCWEEFISQTLSNATTRDFFPPESLSLNISNTPSVGLQLVKQSDSPQRVSRSGEIAAKPLLRCKAILIISSNPYSCSIIKERAFWSFYINKVRFRNMS